MEPITDRRTGTGARRLYRIPQRQMISGVAAGLAEHLGIRVAVVRAAFIILLPLNGVGALLYVALWAVLPGVPVKEPSAAATQRCGDPAVCRARCRHPALFSLAGLRWVLLGAGLADRGDRRRRRPHLAPGRRRPAPPVEPHGAVGAVARRDPRRGRPARIPAAADRRRGADRGRHHRRDRGVRAGQRRRFRRRSLACAVRVPGPVRRCAGARAALWRMYRPAARGARRPDPGSRTRRDRRHGARPGAAHPGV